MEEIHFTCPKGHKVKAAADAAGKLGRCPQCRAVTLVPERIVPLVNARPSLTESAVLRVLGDAEPLPPMAEKSTHVAPRNCPRCNHSLRAQVTICDHCKLYVGLHANTETRATLGDFGY